jgi:F-type H+-transporting ATPase subunit a
MNSLRKILSLIVITVFLSTAFAFGKEEVPAAGKPEKLDVKELILEHLADSYTWHITKIGETDIAIPLPVIVYSSTTGWHVFMSSAFHGNGEHEGLTIAAEGKYKGKIVEKDARGNEVKPFDISITKVVFSLLFNSALLIFIIVQQCLVDFHYSNGGAFVQKGYF